MFQFIFSKRYLACALVLAPCLSTGILSSPATGAEPDMIKDMARFDQAYIPVLALTSQEKLAPARKAAAALNPVWGSFYEKYFPDTRGDAQWQTDLDKIAKYIKASNHIIQSGQKLKNAHEELEHIRVVFMRLRQRNNIEYFIDHLTRFHEPMEAIVLAVKDRAQTDLSENDIIKIQADLRTAKQLWLNTTNATLDPEIFGFDQNKTDKVRKLIRDEQMALDRLEGAIKTRSKKDIIQAGLAVKPSFAKIFMSFGHFPGGS